MKKIILIVLVAAFVIIQFFRPEKNVSGDQPHPMAAKYEVPANVSKLLKDACNNCHSNTTEYPWYAHVQPVAWWLDYHVVDGKKHLNFDDFTGSRIAIQNHKLEEIVETVEEGEMPLKSYTWLGLHAEAKLDDSQRKTLIDWAEQQMDMLKAQYPADSLVMPKRR